MAYINAYLQFYTAIIMSLFLIGNLMHGFRNVEKSVKVFYDEGVCLPINVSKHFFYALGSVLPFCKLRKRREKQGFNLLKGRKCE